LCCSIILACVPDLERENRRCPCPQGFRCIGGICLAGEGVDAGPPDEDEDAGAGVDAGAPDDAGPASDAGTMGDAGCTLEVGEPPTPLVPPSGELALGGRHGGCLIRDGRLFCFGTENDVGQLDGEPGDCGPDGCVREVEHPGGRAWIRVTVGNDHTCAIGDDDHLWCWGANDRSQLGVADPDGLVRPVGFTVSSATASGVSTCAIKGNTRTLFCWGWAVSGQTGELRDGQCAIPGEVTTLPTRIASGTIDVCPPVLEDADRGRWVAIYAGNDVTCAQITDGRAFCWGGLAHGGTGRDHVVCEEGCRPTQLGEAWRTLGHSALHHRCGIDADGDLLCWGPNNHGQLGLGFVSEDATPDYGACTVEPDGVPPDAYDNDRGTEVLLNETEPVEHPMGRAWVRVGMGWLHTCALDDVGEAWCWGNNIDGCADPTTFDGPVLEPTRVDVPTESPLEEIGVGMFQTCARDSEGAVFCWGNYGGRCAGVPDCPRIHELPF